MLNFIARRLLLAIPVLLGVSILVFLVLYLIPGDPAEILLFGSSPLSFPDYLVPNHSMKIAGVNVQVAQVVIFAISIVATGSLYLFLRQSRLGTAMRAVVDNPDLMSLTGTSATVVRRWAWLGWAGFEADRFRSRQPRFGRDRGDGDLGSSRENVGSMQRRFGCEVCREARRHQTQEVADDVARRYIRGATDFAACR